MRLLWIATLAWLVACEPKTGTPETPTTKAPPASQGPTIPSETASGRATVTSDAEVLGVMQTFANEQIDLAKLALDRSANNEVRDFANRLLTEHTNMVSDVDSVAKNVAITGRSSPLSEKLRADQANLVERLQVLRGEAFDRAYVDAMVDTHQRILDLVDQQLMPQARTAAVRDMLERNRSKIRDHGTQARTLRAALASTGTE